MISSPPPRPERRRGVRSAPKGSVVVTAGDVVQRGRIENLSRSGLLLSTDRPAREALLGRAVELELRLDGRSAAWLGIAGTVRRVDAGTLAIELAAPPAAYVQLAEAAAAAADLADQVDTVVVVDARADRRGAIRDAFAAIGCAVVEASSPLEAIVRLGESRFEPDLVVVADSIPSSTSDELRRFVEREHPGATLVTVGDEQLEPAGGPSYWVSSADSGRDLIARIRSLVERSDRG